MAESRALKILNAIKTRCALIKRSGGYETDAGDRVQINPTALDLETIENVGPVIAVTEAGMTIEREADGTRIVWRWPIIVEAEALPRSHEDGPTVAHQLLADLMKALLDPSDTDLGKTALKVEFSSAETGPNPSGGRTVGAAIELTVFFVTGYGDPYN